MSLLFTGAALAASGGVIYSLKGVPKMIFTQVKKRFFYSVRVYQYDDLFDMLEKWLEKNYTKQYKDVEASLGETSYLVAEDKKKCHKIRYKQEENTFIINYQNKRILVTKSKEKVEKALTLKEMYFRKYTLSGFKASREVSKLLEEVLQFSLSETPENEIKIRGNNSYGDWYSPSLLRVKPLNKTILEEEKKQFIISDIQKFQESEQWYLDASIPYKRGYCFFGPPGTGKTTLALSLANSLQRDVYCLNLNCIDDDSRLPYCFSMMGSNSLLLIEDIDKVFSGRENVKEGSKITFSSLLNCLDGAFYKHGLVTIITTNHIEKLDDALLRTGRIDLKIEVPKPTHVEISEYMSLFFEKPITIVGEFNITMSDVQDICLKHRNSAEDAIQRINSKINLEIVK